MEVTGYPYGGKKSQQKRGYIPTHRGYSHANKPKCPASNDDDLLVLGVQDLWVGAILLGSPPASPFVADVTAIQQRLAPGSQAVTGQRLPCSAMLSHDVPGFLGHMMSYGLQHLITQ